MSEEKKFVAPGPLNSAVLFLVFNRLDTTKQVFEAIREAQPPRLYIAADGARSNEEGESDAVAVVRSYILENVDWACEVRTLFRDDNLGCKKAVSGAITWFFETESQGIILEDDCLPVQSFFWYCEELLNKYKDDDSVSLISGDARGPEHIDMVEDYSFCKYPMIWGWASWARVWKDYDVTIASWATQKDYLPSLVSENKGTQRFWLDTFNKMYSNKIDTWDYQLSYLLLTTNGKCIVPKLNQITNVGFGDGATHTFDEDSIFANRKSFILSLPLNHDMITPESEIKINRFYDENEFTKKTVALRVIFRIVNMFFKKNIFDRMVNILKGLRLKC